MKRRPPLIVVVDEEDKRWAQEYADQQFVSVSYLFDEMVRLNSSVEHHLAKYLTQVMVGTVTQHSSEPTRMSVTLAPPTIEALDLVVERTGLNRNIVSRLMLKNYRLYKEHDHAPA